MAAQEWSPNIRGMVLPNFHIITPNNAALTIWQKEAGKPNLQYARIKNIHNTAKVLVCLNDDASAEKFNEILAVDTALGAGNGGSITIPGSWNITKISVITPSGAGDIAVILVTNVNEERVIN